MDNVVLALSISIAVVLVLLVSCWKGPKRPNSKGRNRVSSAEVSSNQVSNTGTGLVNRRANARVEELKNLSGYDDYSQVAQYMSVEPEVYESHSRYSSDMNRSTSGPSYMSERDDPNDCVPWVGLRKPKYQDVFAADGARVDHSESPDQMRKATFYMIG